LVDIVVDEVNLSTTFPSFKLLEVGCGSGAISVALLHACKQGTIKKKLDITAIDKNVDAVHLTKLNANLTNVQKFKVPYIVFILYITYVIDIN